MNHPHMISVAGEISSLLAYISIEETEPRAIKTEESTSTTDSDLSPFDDYEKEKPPENLLVEKDIYNIAYSDEEIDPFSKSYIGVAASSFCTGLLQGGSTSILYPVLVVHEGVTSTMVAASTSIVTIFWSYKIIFGFLSDCFPIFGWKRKPYIVLGWLLSASCLTVLASTGSKITPKHLVLMLTLANLGCIMSLAASDGFVVWIAHREPMHKRGYMQSLMYSALTFGQISINLIILLGFSGPEMNCPGYEMDPNNRCTTNREILRRNELTEDYPNTWCYKKCASATFDFDLSISQYAWIIASVNICSLPLYFLLKEEKAPRESIKHFLMVFWDQLKRRATWQIILYIMISQLTYGIVNAAKISANYMWLNLRTTQYQIMILFERTIFFVSLSMVRKYGLHMSWRKMIWCGSMLVTFFNCLYFTVVFDIWRNSWFYIFTDVSHKFMFGLNFAVAQFCTVEVAEPGFEAITFSLITTASNIIEPLASVISYQFLAFFPDLHTQESIATDTPKVRHEFAKLHVITIFIHLSSLLALPMLPRQKREARELVASGEVSVFWGRFAICSGGICLFYSAVISFVTVVGHETYGCYKIFGGSGCTEDESSIPVYCFIASVLLCCYGVNFVHSFWPILRGRETWSFSMFF